MIRERFSLWLFVVLSLVVLLLPGPVRADVFANVPEAGAEGYQLVYTLPIEDFAAYNITGSVPYSVDNSASIVVPFDRIAYYLELDTGSGLVYVYASMDAFTTDPGQVGLPIDATGASFQRTVTNMNVVSNAGVTTGTGIETGNIEFWPRNYSEINGIGIPAASNSDFDFGDRPLAGGNYGSFQVHNYGAAETIFAYNQWGGFDSNTTGDLGIGTAPSIGNSDWTFEENANSYTVKNLQVLVRPATLSVDSTLERAIFQRSDDNRASVPIAGSTDGVVTSVEARATARTARRGGSIEWQIIDPSPTGNRYSGALNLAGGWYDVDVRSLDGSSVVAQVRIERVGVGEVFLVAGQSNSANWGETALSAVDDRVSTFDLSSWRHADDPLPIADGGGGSPWPALGDLLVADLEVPIGFLSVGVGGTRVDEWLPGASYYARISSGLQALGVGGVRAVLWHQGESDNSAGTSGADYRQRLEAIITQSRIDAGYDVRWGIAQATFLPGLNPTTSQEIIDAQALVVASDPLNFAGSMTDDITGPAWRFDLIHFNEVGLREHAARWRIALANVFQIFSDGFESGDLTAWSAAR